MRIAITLVSWGGGDYVEPSRTVLGIGSGMQEMLWDGISSSPKRQRALNPSVFFRVDAEAVEDAALISLPSYLLLQPPLKLGDYLGILQKCAPCLVSLPDLRPQPTCQSCHMATPQLKEPNCAAASRHTQGSHMLTWPPGMQACVLSWHCAHSEAQ